jgi:hypothetical protein
MPSGGATRQSPAYRVCRIHQRLGGAGGGGRQVAREAPPAPGRADFTVLGYPSRYRVHTR